MKENTFKVIIAGTRDFSDYQFLRQKCDNILSGKQDSSIVVVSGTARGADWQEGERILTQENERVRETSRGQKRALETASLPFVEDQPTVVSSADGAKVQQKSETTKDKEQKKHCLLLHHSALIAGASARQL